jgi:hypothetical protein
VGVAPAARAALSVHDDLKLDYVTTAKNNGPGSPVTYPNGGGPFWVRLYEDERAVGSGSGQQHDGAWVGGGTTMIDAFYTFSAQSSVTLSAGVRYDIQQMQVRTLQAAKVLSGYAAWVFDKFNQRVANGVLNPRLDTESNRNLLGVYQAAIWMGIVGWNDANHDGVFQYAETMHAVGGATAELAADRETYSLGSGAAARSLASESLRYSDFLADTWWSPAGSRTESAMLRTWNGIQLMNLQTGDGFDAQDQMIAYGGPLSVSTVPEPASLLIWGALAAAIVGLRWARQRKQLATRQT